MPKTERKLPTKRNFLHRMWKGKCPYCDRDLKRKELTIDHLYPKCRGGSNEINNLVPSCCKCNQGKGCKVLEDCVSPKKALEIRMKCHLVSINYRKLLETS